MNPPNQPSNLPVQARLLPRPTAIVAEHRGYYVPENAYGLEPTENADESTGLLDYWRSITRNRTTIAVASFAGLLLGFAVCIPMKPVYRAQTSVEVLSVNRDFMNLKQSSPTTVDDGSVDNSEAATQAKLLQSVTLMKRVFAKLDPADAKPKPKPLIAASGWRSLLHLKVPARPSSREVMLSQAAASVKVRETAHTRVLEISVDSSDAELAADYANTLTQEFIAVNSEEHGESTQNTSDWLRKELEDTRDKLRRSEDALQGYARSSGLVFTDENTNAATERLQQVQQLLSVAAADRIAKQSRYELAQSSPPDSLADIVNDSALRDTQSKINDLDRQIADLSAVYKSGYSKVRRLQAERDSLQAAYGQERTEILSRINTDYQESVRKERLLSQAYERQIREVSGQGEKAIQYNILKREVDSNRQLYDTMLQQMKQASIASAMRASNVRIVDKADVPDVPVSPNFKIASGVGMLAGAFLSIVAVIVRDQLDRSIHKPGDIGQWSDLAELGAIPQATIESIISTSAGGSRLLGRASNALKQPETSEFAIRLEKTTMIVEAFRSTLTSILFSSDPGSNPKVLVFTSANPHEGKTTVVSNLALAACEIQLNTLIIDADLRSPKIHERFNLTNEHGLLDLLAGDIEEQDIASAVKSTHINNLHVISAGVRTRAAAHLLLHSPNLALILKKLRSEYDLILIDTPPMIQMTDARVVARQADAVVLVARAGETSRDCLLAAKQRFDSDRVPVMGSILNCWNHKKAVPTYYQPYRQYSQS